MVIGLSLAGIYLIKIHVAVFGRPTFMQFFFSRIALLLDIQKLSTGHVRYICYSPTGRSVLRKTVPEDEYGPRPQAEGRTRDLGHSFSRCGPPGALIRGGGALI